jgi:cardiolipin synthase
VNAANVISLARLLSVPVMVLLILSEQWLAAIGLLVAAGLSDLLDGFLAKRFGMQTDLGAFLDPLADKALLVSVYLALGIAGHLPSWLVILVVSRDLLIVGGVLLAFALTVEISVRPLTVSKINTGLQIALAGVVLSSLAIMPFPAVAIDVLIYAVGFTTVASGASYLARWSRRLSAPQSKP